MRIKSISFLYNGERLVARARLRGTFKIPTQGRTKKYARLTAREVVSHHIIKDCDPVLTMLDGEKIRVYQGGDSSYLPAMIDGILSKHDYEECSYREKENSYYSLGYSSSEQMEFPWEDLYGDTN